MPGCDAVAVDAPNARGQRPLACATSAGHRAVVTALLHRGADLELSDGRQGRSALMLAASEGHQAVVQLLLDAGGVDDVMGYYSVMMVINVIECLCNTVLT